MNTALEQKHYRQLYALASELLKLDAPDELLDCVVERTLEMVQADSGLLVIGDQEQLSYRVIRNWSADQVEPTADRLSRSIVEHVIRSAEPILIRDAQFDDRFSDRESVAGYHVRSILAAPFQLASDRHGVLYLEKKRPFDEHDLEVFQELIETAGHLVRASLDRLPGVEGTDSVEEIPGFPFEGLMTRDPTLRTTFALAARAARSELPILVQGPSGTGKELIIRAIHRSGSRADRPLQVVNCGAITTSLLESELFGHVKGSFTGAVKDRAGMLAAADGGTVFLDEIGELPLELQPKLLRAVQFGELRPVGADRDRKVDFRLLSATNRDLEDDVKEGTFREDLFFRINALTLEVPPLRERQVDIFPLVHFFLERETASGDSYVLSHELTEALHRYSWPGNVRELENEVKRIAALNSPGETLDQTVLSPRILRTVQATKPLTLDASERLLIQDHLLAADGNRSRAARNLGISREGLRKKMKRLGIE